MLKHYIAIENYLAISHALLRFPPSSVSNSYYLSSGPRNIIVGEVPITAVLQEYYQPGFLKIIDYHSDSGLR